MPNRLIAHLAHVEILTPRPDESLRFFQDVIGLDVSARSGQSVYLRAWGEWNHHSLQLTEAPEPGLGHIGWRAWGEEQLATAVERLEADGAGEGWLTAPPATVQPIAIAARAANGTRSSGRTSCTRRRRSWRRRTRTARSATCRAASRRARSTT